MTHIANLAYNAVISYIVVNILKIYPLIYDMINGIKFLCYNDQCINVHLKNIKNSPYNGYPMQLIVQFNLHYSYCTVQFLIVFTRVDNFNDYVSLEF